MHTIIFIMAQIIDLLRVDRGLAGVCLVGVLICKQLLMRQSVEKLLKFS